jgi:hypothetical protein
MRRSVFVFIVTTVLLFPACSAHINPINKALVDRDHIFLKNYKTGQKMAAYVGQPVVKVKDYRIKRFTTREMRASDNFVISGGIVTIAGNTNTDYEVIGETTRDDKLYTVLKLPRADNSGYVGVLIKPNGSIHNTVLGLMSNGKAVEIIYSFVAEPASLRFIHSKKDEIDKEAGFLNYELVYGGTDGKSITITYREYTAEDLARPAFFQNLVYESKKKTIRFRDTVIAVHSVTNEKIEFTVISDNLKK